MTGGGGGLRELICVRLPVTKAAQTGATLHAMLLRICRGSIVLPMAFRRSVVCLFITLYSLAPADLFVQELTQEMSSILLFFYRSWSELGRSGKKCNLLP